MAAEVVVDFLQEARQSLEEVSYAIKEGKMSNTLPCDSSCVHLNLTTFEGMRFCVRLSLRGFEVHFLQLRSQLALHTLLPLTVHTTSPLIVHTLLPLTVHTTSPLTVHTTPPLTLTFHVSTSTA